MSRGSTVVGGAVGLIALTAALVRFTWVTPGSVRLPGGESDVPVLTAPGITLQVRTRTDPQHIESSPQELYATSDGMALYVYARDLPGQAPRCVGSCAQHWRIQQWRYRGRPVYRDVADTVIGQTAGDGAEDGAWQVVLLDPAAGMALPDGIGVREIPDAGGTGLVDDRGHTLYSRGTDRRASASCDAECQRRWHPLEAAAIANSIGEFEPLVRADGITQWMYRRAPLYTFEDDRVPGDANGVGVDPAFRVALTARFYVPPGVAVRRTVEFGTLLTTSAGYTLYQRDRVTAGEERHEFRRDHGSPALGRLLGVLACDAICSREWPPFAAPADAQATGYWSVLTRQDGTRQWAYKGFALHTFAADQPGELRGNRIYAFAPINAAAAVLPLPTTIDPFAPPGTGPGAGVGALFWHAVVP